MAQLLIRVCESQDGYTYLDRAIHLAQGELWLHQHAKQLHARLLQLRFSFSDGRLHGSFVVAGLRGMREALVGWRGELDAMLRSEFLEGAERAVAALEAHLLATLSILEVLTLTGNASITHSTYLLQTLSAHARSTSVIPICCECSAPLQWLKQWRLLE
jgi:hypothetical protein